MASKREALNIKKLQYKVVKKCKKILLSSSVIYKIGVKKVKIQDKKDL